MIDATDGRAMLRATFIPRNKDVLPSRADLTYIQVGKYDRGADDDKEKLYVTSEPVVVAGVHQGSGSVFFFVVDAWMFNRLWVGDVYKGDRDPDWSRFRPDTHFQQARCFGPDRLKPAVLQLAQASNLRSLEGGVQVVLADEAGDGQEVFTIRPIPLPNSVYTGGGLSPPEVELDPETRRIHMTIMLDDRTEGSNPLPVPRYIEGFLLCNDDYPAVEQAFLEHFVHVNAKEMTIQQLFDNMLGPGWKIDVNVLLHDDRSLMTYSWTKHQKEIKEARRWVDNKLKDILPRQLFITVIIRGTQKLDLLKLLGSSPSDDSTDSSNIYVGRPSPDIKKELLKARRRPENAATGEEAGETDGEGGVEEVPSAPPTKRSSRKGNAATYQRARGAKGKGRRKR